METTKNLKFAYEYLVLATGSTPRTLNFNCSHNKIHYLRTIEDASHMHRVHICTLAYTGTLVAEMKAMGLKLHPILG